METGRRRSAGRRGRSPWREPMRRSPARAPWREPMRRSPGRAPWREHRVRSAGWRGTSPRRARSPRRRSPVRWSGVPRVRSRRSRSLSRSRGERRVRRESPAVDRVTQRGRSPRRRTAPQKRPHQDLGAVRCVRVRIEEVKTQSEEVREDGKSTLEEARVVVCEEGSAGAVKETEEERRVVTVEERAGVKKETSDSTAGTTATCDICGVPRRLLRRHIESMHLPWFFRPENSCWKCQWAECSSLHLEKRHWNRHDEEGKFTDQRLATWCESVKAILVFLARQLGKDPERLGEFVSAKGWLQDMEPTLSVSREVLGKQLAAYWRGTVETVATPSPSDVAALLHWRTMMRLLAEVPEGVRSQVRQAPLVDGSAGVLSGAVAIDGHCHLELMRQRVGWKSTIESALGELAESHASAELAGLEAVVTNSVFWDEWITRIPASIGSIRVLQTWGVHPKAVKNVNWCWMEEKLAAAECVAVGECGLDETAGDIELQEKVFKRQILIAHQLKKPLVLHLRGKTSRTTSALYGRALALTTAVLHKRHKIYLHLFSAGQAEFQLWYRSFPELLVGCSWLTTSELSRETMLRSMPATVLALETDSPHLASRSGIVNSPYRIYEQAVTIGRIRNLPTSTVIECSNRALRRFYALWVGAQWLVFNMSARMTSEWINMENLHISSISGTLTRTSQE